jgi:hypothetical protein
MELGGVRVSQEAHPVSVALETSAPGCPPNPTSSSFYLWGLVPSRLNKSVKEGFHACDMVFVCTQNPTRAPGVSMCEHVCVCKF